MKSTAQYVCLAGFIILCAGPALAQDSQLEAIYKCRDIESDAERLACFDAAVGRVKEAEEAGEFTTVTREDVEMVERDAFGFSLPSLPRFSLPNFDARSEATLETADAADTTAEEEIKVERNDEGQLESVTVPVKSVREGPYGQLTVTLENGQVWQQTDTARVRYNDRRPPEEATVRRAAMGSFLMRLDNKGKSFRVRRLR